MEKFNEYQKFTKSLAVYNEDVFAIVDTSRDGDDYPYNEHEHLHFLYPVLALAEEAGEVAGKVAKYVRKKDTDYDLLRQNVGLELGDVMYQLSECARQFGYSLSDIAEMNVNKLTDRRERGVLIGSGDHR